MSETSTRAIYFCASETVITTLMDDFFENLRQYMKQHELLKLKYAQLEKKNDQLVQENEELKLQLKRSQLETATTAAIETEFYT